MIRRWDKSKRPSGPFALNRDCPQAQGLVIWYPMGAGSGKKLALDLAGSTHNSGTTTGNMTLLRTAAPALVFNGSSDNHSVAQSVITATPVSLHAFAAVSSPSTTQCLFGIGSSSVSLQELSSLLVVASKPWALSQQGGGNNKQSIGATTIVAGTEYGFGGIWASDASRIVYLNGVADAAAETTNLAVTGVNVIRLGQRANNADTQYFGGNLGECAAWNVAVSADILRRINDPSTRFELWYPLRSKKWIVAAGGGASNATLIDSAAGADIFSASVVFNVSLIDGASGTDLQAASSDRAASMIDAAAGSDIPSAQPTFPVSLVDSAAGADALSALTILAGSLVDASSGTDLRSAASTLNASLLDGAAGADQLNAGFTVSVTLVDGASVDDVRSALSVLAASLTDGATVAEVMNASRVANVTAIEAAAAADLLNAGNIVNGSLVDGAAGADALNVAAVMIASLVDAASGADQLNAAQQLVVLLTDAAAGSDVLSAPVTYNVSLVDLVAALDVLSAVMGGAVEFYLPDPDRTLRVRPQRRTLLINPEDRTLRIR